MPLVLLGQDCRSVPGRARDGMGISGPPRPRPAAPALRRRGAGRGALHAGGRCADGATARLPASGRDGAEDRRGVRCATAVGRGGGIRAGMLEMGRDGGLRRTRNRGLGRARRRRSSPPRPPPRPGRRCCRSSAARSTRPRPDGPKADVLIEGETISAIGPGLKGDTEVDASGAYVMPGGHRPARASGDALHGHLLGRRLRHRHGRGGGGRHDDGGRLLHARPDGSMLARWDDWVAKSKDKANGDYAWHMCVTGWNETHLRRDGEVVKRGVNTFKHFMAYKGALMVNDDEMFASFRRVRRPWRPAAGACRERRRGGGTAAKLMAEGNTGRRATPIPARRGRGRGDQPRDHDRRHAAGVPLYIVHVSCEQAHEAIRRARAEGHAGLWRAADPAPDARRERVPVQGLGPCRAAGDVAAVPRRNIRPASGPGCNRARCRSWRPTTAPSPPSRSGGDRRLHQDPQRHRRAGGPAAGALDLRGRDRAADAEEFVAVTSTNIAKILNCYPRRARSGRCGCRLVVWDPEGRQDHHGRQPEVGDRLQRVRGREGEGPAALHAEPRRGVWSDGRCGPEGAMAASSSARRLPAVNRGAEKWKELTAPRPVVRDRHSRDGGLSGRCAHGCRRFAGDRGARAGPHLRDRGRAGACADRRDLTIDRGDFVSFIGPSGCGKTTFLRASRRWNIRPPARSR
jgi:dihydropyrimidinase